MDDLSPKEALLPDNIARLQKYFLKKRYEKVQPYKHRKPYFQLNDPVKVIQLDKFRQRGDKPRFSKKSYRISQILDDSIPICYRVTGHGSTLFYREQLTLSSDELEEKKTHKRILSILSDKQFATRWLRSGKAIQYEKRYLVRLNDKDEPSQYLTRKEIEEYDNGKDILEIYEKK